MHLSLVDLDPAQVKRRQLSPATKVLRIEGPVAMQRGGMLPVVDIAYETWGEANVAGDNTVLLFTGLSPSAHATSSAEDPSPGWWEYMIGPDKPIDTNRYRVVCVNSLGGCYGTTGPSSIDPRTGEPYNVSFPALAVEDIANTAHRLMEALGVARVHAVVGASLGGMVALAYAVLHPQAVRKLVTISAASHAMPFAIAVRSLQREIIRSDPAWRNGAYPLGEGPVTGMRLARKLGLTSYRAAEEWQRRFGRDRVEAVGDDWQPFDAEFEVEAYLEHNAAKFSTSFDANSYLYLSRAMDWFDVAEHGGTLEAALGRIEAECSLVIGVESDTLFPLAQQQELADGLRAAGKRVRFLPLASLQGHDSFLVDTERFAPAIADFFANA